MANLLKENSRVITVKAEYNDDTYRYAAEYETAIDGKTLNKMSVQVFGKGGEYVGMMVVNEDGSKNFNFPGSISISAMDTLFAKLITEVKSGLA